MKKDVKQQYSDLKQAYFRAIAKGGTGHFDENTFLDFVNKLNKSGQADEDVLRVFHVVMNVHEKASDYLSYAEEQLAKCGLLTDSIKALINDAYKHASTVMEDCEIAFDPEKNAVYKCQLRANIDLILKTASGYKVRSVDDDGATP